jgi:hypothetical protein
MINVIDQAVIETIIAGKNNFFMGNKACFSETRDVFTARMQSYILETRKYLEAAVIGEIGNNTFDHNFIFENPYPRGVYCDIGYKQKYVVIADYGKGIWRSLSTVAPSISSDMEALETAFTKKISGRYPEQRGNGLKFVAKTVQKNNWHLFFQSGSGCCSIDNSGLKFFEAPIELNGCLAAINFSGG